MSDEVEALNQLMEPYGFRIEYEETNGTIVGMNILQTEDANGNKCIDMLLALITATADMSLNLVSHLNDHIPLKDRMAAIYTLHRAIKQAVQLQYDNTVEEAKTKIEIVH